MDVLLEKFFEHDRWEYAINVGVDKGITKKDLRELQSEQKRIELLERIINGTYKICPPHQAEIPKDDGTMRVVYVNEGIDRVFLSIVNDMLFELCPEMLSKNCVSYQKGIGCGKIVTKVSENIIKYNTLSWKADLSKYFDSVPVKYIDEMFDKVEEKFGKSKIIDVLRDYYHSDYCFDTDGNLINHYQSLKQGCAVASWLADVVLKHIDDKISELDGYYVRYSDDILFVGKDAHKAMDILKTELEKMEMKLNPKKVEWLDKDHWFKFLGFNIKGSQLSLSKKRVHNLTKAIYDRVKNCHSSKSAMNKIYRYLYHGEHSWATNVLAIINCEKDIQTIDNWIKDIIRIADINKRTIKMSDVGGLGVVMDRDDYTIIRGKGKRVKKARERQEIPNYKGLTLMRNALLQGRNVYDATVLNLNSHQVKIREYEPMTTEDILQKLDDLYAEYKTSVPSEHSENSHSFFKALDEDELTMAQMCLNERREVAKRNLEEFLFSCIHNRTLVWNEEWGNWYHCGSDRDFVILRDWF